MATERLQELFAEGRQVATETVENLTGQLASLTSKVTSEVESEAHQVRLELHREYWLPRANEQVLYCC